MREDVSLCPAPLLSISAGISLELEDSFLLTDIVHLCGSITREWKELLGED